MAVLIIKNETYEGPGILKDILDKHHVQYTTVDLDNGEEFPDPTEYKAVIVLGGTASANDTSSHIQNEIKQIKKIVASNIPYLGICLGSQVLAKAAGCSIIKSPLREVGFLDPDKNPFTIILNTEAKKDQLFKGLNHELKVFHVHGEMVDPRPPVQLLATGKWAPTQVIKVGNSAYGFQSHFELTKNMFDEWCKKNSWLNKMDKQQLQKDWDSHSNDCSKAGEATFTNFLEIAELI